MSEISSSIWNQDKNGEWKLYFNSYLDFSPPSHKNKEEKKLIKTTDESDKNLLLGTLVMTPKGIGHLIKSLDGTAHVRFNQDINEYQFPINEVTNTFICFILFIIKGSIDTIRLKLKASGKVENIFEELSKIKKININNNNYSLIYKKTELKNETTFEQLKLKDNTKMLILEIKELEKKITRFQIIQKYWYCYNRDGICFSVNENIKLLGISLYCSNENKVINGNIKISEGNSMLGKVLLEENVEIPPSTDKLSPSYEIKFSKPVFCKKNVDYAIILSVNNGANCYSGSNGKFDVQGDKGIIFTFKKIEGNRGGSTANVGNFPELFYHLIKN